MLLHHPIMCCVLSAPYLFCSACPFQALGISFQENHHLLQGSRLVAHYPFLRLERKCNALLGQPLPFERLFEQQVTATPVLIFLGTNLGW